MCSMQRRCTARIAREVAAPHGETGSGLPASYYIEIHILSELTRAALFVQYAASVHSEKLKKVLHRAANRERPAGQTVGKQYFNPRLVPEEVHFLI